jgi:hypothetical protein
MPWRYGHSKSSHFKTRVCAHSLNDLGFNHSLGSGMVLLVNLKIWLKGIVYLMQFHKRAQMTELRRPIWELAEYFSYQYQLDSKIELNKNTLTRSVAVFIL